ncbi:transport protein particle component-domain-containing protein [Limtongia smithiae]|uniref:transport protein particle component-domain-containing protein n=1 Tax=Limtongia smithiae TaxID=1125753 RepID=UPI0034CEA274
MAALAPSPRPSTSTAPPTPQPQPAPAQAVIAPPAAAAAAQYADPHAIYLSLSCLDFLLIELIPLSERIVEVTGDHTAEDTPADAGAVLEQRHNAIFKHVEGLGYRVGQGLVERFSQDRPRFADVLDVMKFVCKDLWHLLFRKQIDNLKTNHRGVYVLTDQSFRLLMRMSSDAGSRDAAIRALPYLWFPCGVIRGALASLGVQATVVAETSSLPIATFHVQTLRQE